MNPEPLTGGTGTDYVICVNEVPDEELAANEIYRAEIKVAKTPEDPYVFSCQASFNTEAMFYARRMHSERSDMELKEDWLREITELARHLARHYF